MTPDQIYLLSLITIHAVAWLVLVFLFFRRPLPRPTFWTLKKACYTVVLAHGAIAAFCAGYLYG